MGEPPATPCRGKSNILTANNETPAIAKQTSTASYVPGSLEQGCTFLLADIGESVPQIMVESFFDNILPPLFEGLDVDEVITALEGQGRITQLKRWNGFAVDPADSTEKKRRE